MLQIIEALTTPYSDDEIDNLPGDLGRAAGDRARTLDRHWTRGQLQAAADMDRAVQKRPEHMLARMALANEADSLNVETIRGNVARSMGGVAGTYYVVAALHLAYLALAFPNLLTDTQRNLLTAPLKAAEGVSESVRDLSPKFEVSTSLSPASFCS